MSCCFKPQKEKYEFGGGSDHSVQMRKQSAKVQKRHSKILTGEVAFTPSNTDNHSHTPNTEQLSLHEQKENGASNPSSVTVTNSVGTAGAPDTFKQAKTCAEKDDEKSTGVTVIAVSGEEVSSSSTSAGGHGTGERHEEAHLTPDMDTNQDNGGIDGDNNNNVKNGQVIVIDKEKRSSSTEERLKPDSETGESKTHSVGSSSRINKMVML